MTTPATTQGVQVTTTRSTVGGRARFGPDDGEVVDLRGHCHGTPPVQARLEPWQVAVCAQPDQLQRLVDSYGSPINLHHPGPFARNVAGLREVAAARNVALEVLFARKANKAMVYVDQARELGLGVDTASEEELTQVLEHGLDPGLVVTTAAIKTDALLRQAIAAGVTIVLDNDDELAHVLELTECTRSTASIALRFGGFHLDGRSSTTRFGFEVSRGQELGRRLARACEHHRLRLEGAHFHLDGYAVAHRVAGVLALLPVIDAWQDQGHPIRHLDVGGGLPMSYVDDPGQWASFRAELRRALLGEREPITYDNHGLGWLANDGAVHGELALYPYHQRPTAAAWLAELLDATGDGRSTSVADELRARSLTLRCEPGRSLLDGCGLTVARVEHRKRHGDGSWTLGMAMNRSQCATSKADHAVDPLLLPNPDPDAVRTGVIEGYLVGAYCTESDLLTWRRLRFPHGVARGDLAVFPNTAGYLMHFVESRSHRFPLANNLVMHPDSGAFALDAIDRRDAVRWPAPQRAPDTGTPDGLAGGLI